MQNGPIYSNISNINRAFRIFGSPLHTDIIIDYVRTNWENGRGTSTENALNLVKYPLEAQFYYNKAEEEDHYLRRISICDKLDDLYKQMKWNPNPWLFSTKTAPVKLNEVYLDPRFDILSSDGGNIYLILTDWNLLNDLVFRFLVKNNINEIQIQEVYREVIMKYSIEDPSAYFFPKIDPRFKVNAKNTVSLLSRDLPDDKSSGQVTEYIKENVAIKISIIKNYLADKEGVIKIREIIQKFFLIQTHFSLFNAYFEAVKQSLSLIDDIILVNDDSLVFSKSESEAVPQKIHVLGNSTDIETLTKKVTSLPDTKDILEKDGKQSFQNETARTERETLSYTLRYFDRIQETITAHYFKDWIEENHIKVKFQNDNDEILLVFHYDKQQNILYGDHLSNFMIDYDLEPGQKIEFKKADNIILMKLGLLDKVAHTEQMKYEDIARLSEVKHYGTKSLLQNLAELLMLHPSGMHIRQIVLDIKGETSYAENSIRGTLSSYPFFETIPGKVGYWRFNPRQWKKTYLKVPDENKAKEKQHELKEELPLSAIFRRNAYATLNNRRKLTNLQFETLPKEKFLELAWEYYSFIIYQYAKNNKCSSIPLEDFYQEAFFALNKAYNKYNPEQGNSFYHYFKIYLSAHINRYKIDHMGLVRIPVHRAEELIKLDKIIGNNLLLNGDASIHQDDIYDYTLYKTYYLSIEELYLKYLNSDLSPDGLHARVYSYFENPIYHDDDVERDVSLDYINIEEPDQCHHLVQEDDFENSILNRMLAIHALEYLRNKAKKDRDYEVILHRHGFTTGKEMTLEEVGELYGITRERVRQVEAKSMNILKNFKELKGEAL